MGDADGKEPGVGADAVEDDGPLLLPPAARRAPRGAGGGGGGGGGGHTQFEQHRVGVAGLHWGGAGRTSKA